MLNFTYLLYMFFSFMRKGKNSIPIVGIVFSKDRPLQLNALLSSYYKCVERNCRLVVLYKASSESYANAYMEVMRRYAKQDIIFKMEKDFKLDLIDCLKSSMADKIYFLVDDIIFFRKFDLMSLCRVNCMYFIPSMRLGRNIVYSYMTNKRIDLPPMIKSTKRHLLYWSYWTGKGDWNYAFSVDGNIYSKKELLFLIERIDFWSPNSFEANMNKYRFVMKFKWGVCFENSVLFNNPINKVQLELPNRSGSISPDSLLELFNADYEIDIESYKNLHNNSAHYEGGIKLRERRLHSNGTC